MRNSPRAILVALAIVAAAGVAPVSIQTASAQSAGKATTTASGLQYTDTKVGTGPSKKPSATKTADLCRAKKPSPISSVKSSE